MSHAPLRILIDGQCPLCRREAALLRRLDRGRGRLAFIDIAAPDFDACSYGLTPDDAHARIHALRRDGAVVTGMEVFRQAYAAVGWGWLLAPTGWPILRPLCDAAYRWFARNRLRLTGRGQRCTAQTCGAADAGRAPPRG